MYRQKTFPFKSKKRTSRFIDPNTYLKCGLIPSKMGNKIRYEFKHHVKTNQYIQPPLDVKYELKKSNVKFSTDMLALDVVAYDRNYNENTTINYSEIEELIKKILNMKSKMEFNSTNNYNDIFKDVVKTFPQLLNRASLKLVNLNYAFDNIIGSAIKNGTRFADLCCAPGGFTHYLLHAYSKIKMDAYLTTMSHVDTYLPMDEQLHNIPCRTNINISFGDICSEDHRNNFKMLVLDEVDFILADGGIDFSGKENYQEFYSKKLYISQMILGMDILKTGGFIICKYFDVYTTFSSSLLYLLSFVFESIVMCKPISSKPGNAERYILFKGYHKNYEILDHLKCVINKENEFEKYNLYMINNIVSKEILESNSFQEFVESLMKVNKNITINQFTALQKYMGVIKTVQNNNNAFDYYKAWVRNK